MSVALKLGRTSSDTRRDVRVSVGRCRCNQNTGKLTTNANSVSVVTHIFSVGPRELSVSVGPHKRWSCEYIHPKPPNFGGSRVGLDALDLMYDTNRFRSNKSYLINIKNHPCLICPFRGSCQHIRLKLPNFGGPRVDFVALDLICDTNRLRSNKSYFISIKNHLCLICLFRRSCEHIYPEPSKPPNFGGSRVGLDALDLTYDTNRL